MTEPETNHMKILRLMERRQPFKILRGAGCTAMLVAGYTPSGKGWRVHVFEGCVSSAQLNAATLKICGHPDGRVGLLADRDQFGGDHLDFTVQVDDYVQEGSA